MAIIGAQHGVRSRGYYNVEVKLEGQIFRFNFLTNHIDKLLVGAAIAAQKEFAEKYARKVKENILNGGKRFHYPPHSSKYRKWKTRSGGPSRLLYWSGTMANSVRVIPYNKGKHFSVGIPRGTKRQDYPGSDNNRLTVSEYANVLEHGRPPYMPARPVFSDTFRETMGGMTGLKKAIEAGIILRLGRNGYLVSKL